ncbi:MAG: carbohydrate kinase family protein [Clostridia bacterium]|nr:carbohydrate kinase family protein [Clostridia bacterium]
MGKRKFDILCAGLMVYDIHIGPVDESIFTQDQIRLESIDYATGGDALNAATVASKLGMSVCLGGCIGNDAPGRFLKEQAEKNGVNTDAVYVSEDYKTAVSVVIRRPDGNRHFAYYGEANDAFDGSTVTDDMLKNSSVLYVASMMSLKGLEGEPLADLFRRAKSFGTITAMDTTWPKDGIWMPKLEKALKYTDIFIPSGYEARELAGETEPEKITAFLHERGVKIAGVKLGKDGAYIEGEYLPAYRCDSIADTTGAGDSFMSGFISGIVMGRSVSDSAHLGSAASNACIRRIGATAGAVSLEEADKITEMHKNGTLK